MREELLEDAKKRASHGAITFDPETAKAEAMALFSKHHIERLKQGEDNHKVHCIAAEGFIELHPTLRRGVREVVPGWVLEGSPGVRSAVVRLAVLIRTLVITTIAIGLLIPHHHDLFMGFQDDIVVVLVNAE
jgi:hypothetical protein